MSTFTAQREKFREILARESITRPASIFDAVSARMAEDAGFELGILGGSVASHTILGAPDVTVITLSELAEQTRRISRASSISFFIDADHGYGNALSVMRTIEELEVAGAAAATIEDTSLPSAFGRTGPELISVEEFSGKLKAAVAARRDPSFVVIGRTSAIRREGIDSTLRRIEACNEAGVDAIMLAGGAVGANLQAIAAATKLPLIGGEVPDEALAIACRVRIADWNHFPFAAVIKSLRESYDHIAARRPAEELRDRATSAELTRIALAEDAYSAAAKAYLS